MLMHRLKERTYLDAEGKATTDEAEGVSLLGIQDDEITAEQAHAAGLVKSMPEEKAAPEAKMLFYNAEGKKVAEGSSDIAVQFLDNDPNRPDAPKAAGAAAEPAADAEDQGDGLDGMKKADLADLAESEGVDLSEAKNNADRVAAIRAAREA